jgi:hypothetical protein
MIGALGCTAKTRPTTGASKTTGNNIGIGNNSIDLSITINVMMAHR